MDSREPLGEVTERSVLRTEPCEEKPYAGAAVRLVADSSSREILGEATADDRGRVMFAVSRLAEQAKRQGWSTDRNGQITVQKYNVLVDGMSAGAATALETVYAEWGRSWVAEDRAQEARKRAEDVREEVAIGRCTDERHAQLQEMIQFAEMAFDSMDSVEDAFDIEATDTTVATEKGTELKLDVGLGGEMHVYVIGFDPVTLDVRDSKGYPAKAKSIYETVFSGRGETDSRVVRAKTRERIAVRVKGGGCALVMAVRRY